MQRLRFANFGFVLLCAAGVGVPQHAVHGQTRLPTNTVGAVQPATGVLIGRVLTSDGRPGADALVVIGAVPDVRSNSTGAFFVQHMPIGVHTLEVRTFGAPPTRREVSVAGGDTIRVDITLARTLYQLETLRTVGNRLMKESVIGTFNDFYDRMQRGQGRFFSREEIRRAVTVDQLMSTIPGVRIQRSIMGDVSISFARCQSPVNNLSGGLHDVLRGRCAGHGRRPAELVPAGRSGGGGGISRSRRAARAGRWQCLHGCIPLVATGFEVMNQPAQ